MAEVKQNRLGSFHLVLTAQLVGKDVNVFPADSHNHGTHGSGDDAQQENHREIVLDDRDVAEKITHTDQRDGPDAGAQTAVKLKAGHAHAGGTGYQWGKSSYDRHETSKHDRLAAVLFVEDLRLAQRPV